MSADGTWVPESCTLPTPEIPLRVAEFDALFAGSLRATRRLEPTLLRMVLGDGDAVEATARDLAARETGCCSFFDFTVSRDGAATVLDVRVPAAHTVVLDGLAARATAATRG